MTAIGEAAGGRRRDRSGRADQREQPDPALGEAVCADELICDRRPIGAEHREHHRLSDRAPAQHRLGAGEPGDRGEQVSIAGHVNWLTTGQEAREQRRERKHQDR
jgi:hypothetical protein